MDEGFRDFKAWYLTKPIVARTYVTVSLLLAALFGLQVISYAVIPYTFNLTIFSF